MTTRNSIQPSARSSLCIAIGMVLALSAGAVAAQQAAPADAAGDPQAAPTPASAAVKLDTVIVTANKRPEDAMNVASSISVIGDQQLENIAAGQLTDYANYVPGLQAASDGTPGQTRVSLRGIAPLSSGATVGTYIDDTPVGSSGIYQAATLFMLDLLPYDVSHVEVLRGPQGTLYGAGSMGGLIKYVTRDPDTTTREFRFGGGVSSVAHGENGHNIRFGANLPLSRDSLGLRVSYARNDLPGYIDNPETGEADINDATQTSARVALKWQGEGVDVKVSAMRQTIDSDNNATVSLTSGTRAPRDGDLTHRVYVDEPFSKDINYYAATLGWDLGWGDFTSSSGYSKIDTRRRQDQTIDYGEYANLGLGLPEPGSAYFDNALDFTQFTQEFRLASKMGQRFDWLVGAYYSREKGDNRQHIALNQRDGSPLPPPYDGIAGDLATLNLPTRFKETAVFANGSFAVTERFKIGAGVRYAKNDQSFVQIVKSGLLLPPGEAPNTSSEDVVTWSLTPQFKLTEDSLLYARVATGYQPGGPNAKLPGVPDQVDSSTLTNYELGWKSKFADNRVQMDVAAFYIDWKDIQVSSFFNGYAGLVNGGTAISKGLEFSAQLRPTANLQLGFNAAYTDATLTQNFPLMRIAADPYLIELTTGHAGDRMPYTPKIAVSATADYYFPLGNSQWEGHVGGGYRWVDDRVEGTTQRQVVYDPSTTPATPLMTTITPPIRLGSYGSLDLYAGVSNERWSIRAYLKNAGDVRAYSTITDHLNQLTEESVEYVAAPIQPRTVGLEFDYRF